MRVLVVCSYRPFMSDGIAAFISEQMETIAQLCNSPIDDRCIDDRCVEIEYYLIMGKGIFGYLRELPLLRKAIRAYKPDIIHAHYGLCGLLANLATRRVPVVTTYHGSDINDQRAYRYARFSLTLSKWNIFVSEKQVAKVQPKGKYSVIPCGVNMDLFDAADKQDCRKALGLDAKKKYVLFSKMFYDPVKNYPLAKAAVDLLKDVELLEFIGYTREQTMMLMNAVDAVIMTSISEGSPQFIKEAMACGCPIVSVDVGDVKERVEGVDGCYLVKSREPRDISEALEKALAFEGKTKGREKLIADGFDNKTIAQQVIEVYRKVLNKQ